MLTVYMFEKIRLLRSQGKNISQVARELKIDRKTVRKYLLSNCPPSYASRAKSTRIDPFMAFTDRARFILSEHEDWTPTDLFEVLREEGYQGSEKTIRRKMHLLRPPKDYERYFQQEYTPGEQSQFDFKEKVSIPFISGEKIVHLHFSTLPYSDRFFIKSYPFKNLECFLDGIHSFFENIGGLTTNIRFDNLSPCVKKVLKGNERIYTDDFSKAVNYYGFGLLPCSPGKGNEKGDVEREIRTHARRIKKLIKFGNVVFKDFSQLNDWLLEYAKNKLGKGNQDKFVEEKKQLLPLPPRNEEVLCRVESFTGGPHGTVKLKNSLYSIPDSFIGLRCLAFVGAYDVKITAKSCPGIEVKHPRMGDGDKSILWEHVIKSLLRKPAAMIRWCHKEILFPVPIFKKYYVYLKSKDTLRAEKEFLKTVNLTQHVSWVDLEIALDIILSNNSTNPFEDIKYLLLSEQRPPIADIFQPPLKPNLQVYDQFIPH